MTNKEYYNLAVGKHHQNDDSMPIPDDDNNALVIYRWAMRIMFILSIALLIVYIIK